MILPTTDQCYASWVSISELSPVIVWLVRTVPETNLAHLGPPPTMPILKYCHDPTDQTDPFVNLIFLLNSGPFHRNLDT